MTLSVAPRSERVRPIGGLLERFARWAWEAARPWHRRALALILAVAAVVDFYRLQQMGYANTYYAAAVKSMLLSWHNFFFVSFDPGGFVSVDKPPLGFWIQTASAKLFGFSGFSILLPEALAGVLSVAVLYVLVRRVFGIVPALLAALALALMPVSVVTNRNNTIDSLLVLTVLLAAYAVSRAVESGSWRWLVLCAVLVGLGFNIKMLEAYLVVPAFAAVYLFGAPRSWRMRLDHLALAGAVLLAVSLVWVVAVDLTPASARPYVGSSQTNSELELALGYNGIQRLTGGLFGRAGAARTTPAGAEAAAAAPAGGGFGFETGQPGLLRLFSAQLGGQASWLLPLALIGLLASGWMVRPRQAFEAFRAGRIARAAHLNARQSAWVLWGLWTATQVVFFSVANFFHTYYLSMLAPGVAALAGIGAYELWQDVRRPGWRRALLPLALALTALAQVYVLANFPGYANWLSPVIIAGTLLAIGVLLWTRLRAQPDLEERGLVVTSTVEGGAGRGVDDRPRLRLAAAALGLAVLFVGQVLWVGISLERTTDSALPSAGPVASVANFGARRFGFREVTGGTSGAFPGAGGAPSAFAGAPGAAGELSPGGFGGRESVDQGLLRYLQAHQGTTTYLLATSNANSAAPYILATGKPVMALGGFLGSDPILTTTRLQQLVRNGTVRYVLVSGGGVGRFGRFPSGVSGDASGGGFPGGFGGVPGGGGSGTASGTAALERWVTSTCTVVPASAYGDATAGAQALYDCASASQQ